MISKKYVFKLELDQVLPDIYIWQNRAYWYEDGVMYDGETLEKVDKPGEILERGKVYSGITWLKGCSEIYLAKDSVYIWMDKDQFKVRLLGRKDGNVSNDRRIEG